MDSNVADAYRRGENLHLIAFNYCHAADDRKEAVELIVGVLNRIADTGYAEEHYQSQRFVKDRGRWLSKDEVGTFTQEFIANDYEKLMKKVRKRLD